METDSTERAVRVADVMQLFAQMVVLVVIVPLAVLLAAFFILEPIIPDSFVRGFLSFSVGVGLGGLLLIKTGRPFVGSSLASISTIVAAVFLSILWVSFHAMLYAVHGVLILNLLILYNLKRSEHITHGVWSIVNSVMGVIVVLSGPLALCLTLLAYGFVFTLVLAIAPLSLSIYMIIGQYLTRDIRLGIPNISLLSLACGLIGLHIHLTSTVQSTTILQLSILGIATGLGLVVSAQITRRIQIHLLKSPRKKKTKKKERARIESMIGIELDDGSEGVLEEAQPVEEEFIPLGQGWLIDLDQSMGVSAAGVILSASGLPIIFLWLASLTEWGLSPQFIMLMGPIAILFAFLVYGPAPVLLRLGGFIKRSTETRIVQCLGVSVVAAATLTVFFWMLYFLWPLHYSILVAFFLLISGLTGLFREVRRLWRRLWEGITGSFRRMKRWVKEHPLHAGVFADLVVSGLVAYVLYPELSTYPYSIIGALLVGITSFSFFGVLGVAVFRSLPRREQLLVLAWTALLTCFSLLTFWYLYFASANSLFDAMRFSILWYLGSAVLLKLEVPRSRVAILFLPAAASAAFMFWEIESLSFPVFQPLFTIIAALVLLFPLLRPEYSIALIATLRVLVRVGNAIQRGIERVSATVRAAAAKAKVVLVRIGSAVKRSITRIWSTIYRGAVFLGQMILRFILIAYAVVIITALSTISYNFIHIQFEYDLILAAFIAALVFFILYLPLINYKKMNQSPIMWICIVGLAISAGIVVFYFSETYHMALRVFAAAVSTSCILTISRNQLPDSVRRQLVPATWVQVLYLVAIYLFLELSPSMGLLPTLAMLSVLFGVGLFFLRYTAVPINLVNGLYIIFVLPAGVFLTAHFVGGILFILLAGIIIPLPVAYKSYFSFFTWLGSTLMKSVRIALMVAAIHLVLAMGVVAIVVAAFITLQLAPLFFLSSYPMLPTFLTFLVITLAIWLPIIELRREENPLLLSSGVILLITSLCLEIFLYLDHSDLLIAGLQTLTLFGVLLSLAVPGIHFLERRRGTLTLVLASLIGWGIYILPVDNILKLMLLGFSVTILCIPYATERSIILFVYPIAMATAIGMLFYVVVLPTTDLVFGLACYVAVLSLLLNIPEEIRSGVLWWTFAGSSGLVLFLILSPLTVGAPLIALLWVIELIRLTPDTEFRFDEFFKFLDVFRSFVVGATAFLLLIPYVSFPVAIESGLLVFLITLELSCWKYTSPKTGARINLLEAFTLSAILFTFQYVDLLNDPLNILIPSSVPVIILALYRTNEGPFRGSHWFLLTALLTINVGIVWYVIYRSIESLLLVPTTGLFVALACTRLSPNEAHRTKSITAYMVGSFVLLVESIWIWYAVLFLHLPATPILAGMFVLSMLSISYPMLEPE
ncbi:MAG: hypothetical protein RTU30_14065, partial [Candidatus Thorarchaeota archaeon]